MTTEPERLVVIEGDGPDVIGAYQRAGWTIDAEGRWHPPGDDDDEGKQR